MSAFCLGNERSWLTKHILLISSKQTNCISELRLHGRGGITTLIQKRDLCGRGIDDTGVITGSPSLHVRFSPIHTVRELRRNPGRKNLV